MDETKLNRGVLNKIHETTLRYMNSLTKDPYKSHKEHLALCWTLAVIEVLTNEGVL